jgi:hypothetical protein
MPGINQWAADRQQSERRQLFSRYSAAD